LEEVTADEVAADNELKEVAGAMDEVATCPVEPPSYQQILHNKDKIPQKLDT